MSDSVIFDQLSFVKRGVEVGVPREHAEWLAQEQTQLLENNLATKTDIANVQHEIELLRKDTKALVLESKNELIKWFVVLSASLVFAGVGILVQVLLK